MNIEKWLELSKEYPWIKESYEAMSEKQIEDAFYKELEFGTAGMRGVLGMGPNRMNDFTVARANYAFGQYLTETFSDKPLKVAIAYDNRHQSREFADVSARVLSTFGIESHVFQDPRPTPELSFAVRSLGCVGGIVITASHNPKEYNGYKIYDETGCQLVDNKVERVIEIIGELGEVTDIILPVGERDLIHQIPFDFDSLYMDAVKSLQLRKELDKKVKIVFSSQHGTSYPIVPNILEECGYDVIVVKEQSNYDPDFTNTKTPNPEERASYELPIEYAEKYDADLILVCDPDADRMGIVVKHQGQYVNLTGNQGGSLLQDYIYSSLIEKKMMPEHPYMFNTVVTSNLGELIAKKYDVNVEKTLTGFKYIGEKIENLNKSKKGTFVFGYEESYGYLIKEFVRDKDAPQACIMVAEMANYYLHENKTLVDRLNELYDEFGYYHEDQVAFTLAGAEGLAKIQETLSYFRNHEITEIGGLKVVDKEDYLLSVNSKGDVLNFPKSNVLKFFLEDGSWIAIRPSGTEPKCKFYYCVVDGSPEKSYKKFMQLKNAIAAIAKL